MMMSAPFEWKRSDTMKFINLLVKYPSLWKVKSPMYKNKILRLQSAEQIIEELGFDINISDIERKIACLRAQYRREKRLYATFIENGMVEEYVPKLWCYHSLSFLVDWPDERQKTDAISRVS